MLWLFGLCDLAFVSQEVAALPKVPARESGSSSMHEATVHVPAADKGHTILLRHVLHALA